MDNTLRETGDVDLCLNPTCSQPKASEDSLCCEACNTLRETTDADICESCGDWTDHAKYDASDLGMCHRFDVTTVYCDECYKLRGDEYTIKFTENDREIIRFALSFLSANLYDAVFADFDEDMNAMDWAGTESELAVRVQALHTMFEKGDNGREDDE